jgi:sugar phosphate isomerase/epimerase
MKNETDMELAVNTFGMGGPLRKDFHMTIESLLNHRITSVEPCILFLDKGNVLEKALTKAKRGIDKLGGVWTPDEAEKKISLMREAGLRVEGAHLFKKNITRSTAVRAAMFAKKNNLSYYVLSYAEEKVEKVDKYIPLLRDACTIFEQYGIHLLIHNHSVDLNEMKGLCVFDFLLENVPGLEIQMDLGWVHYAGKDCMNLMERYKDRIRLLHFKDIWPGGMPGKSILLQLEKVQFPLQIL